MFWSAPLDPEEHIALYQLNAILKSVIAKLSPSSSLAKPNWGPSLVLILIPPAPTHQPPRQVVKMGNTKYSPSSSLTKPSSNSKLVGSWTELGPAQPQLVFFFIAWNCSKSIQQNIPPKSTNDLRI